MTGYRAFWVLLVLGTAQVVATGCGGDGDDDDDATGGASGEAGEGGSSGTGTSGQGGSSGSSATGGSSGAAGSSEAGAGGIDQGGAAGNGGASNAAPQFVGLSQTQSGPAGVFTLSITGRDPDGDALTFTWTPIREGTITPTEQAFPAGSVDVTSEVDWDLTGAAPNTYSATVGLEDEHGAVVGRTLTVEITN